jgi:hypothetical protein
MDRRTVYAERGCVLLEGLTPAEVAASMVFQAQVGQKKANGPTLAKPNVSHLPTIELYGYAWPTLLGLHWGLTAAVEEAAGVRLLPSYAYFRTYQQGDRCKVHIDRPSCEHSLSLTIGYSDDQPWALCVGEREWTIEQMRADPMAADFGEEPYAAFAMRPGDGVLYRGVVRRHGRVAPNPNRWSAHLFLHWVERGGPFAEWAFDRQKVFADGDFRFAPA